VALRIAIPDGIMITRPQPKAGWTLSIETTPLPQPVINEGAELKDRVIAVTWRGRLPVDQFDQFGVMLRLPAGQGPLYFPTVQTCERERTAGSTFRLRGRPGPRFPAPILTLSSQPVAAKSAMNHDHQ
jgi:uncharacterized protein YcnI